jgi:hypothetical protein
MQIYCRIFCSLPTIGILVDATKSLMDCDNHVMARFVEAFARLWREQELIISCILISGIEHQQD